MSVILFALISPRLIDSDFQVPNIFLLQDSNLVEMREQPHDSEDLLRRLLAEYPNILAGD